MGNEKNVNFEISRKGEEDCPVETLFVQGMRVEINKDQEVVGKSIYKDIIKESNAFQNKANKREEIKIEN